MCSTQSFGLIVHYLFSKISIEQTPAHMVILWSMLFMLFLLGDGFWVCLCTYNFSGSANSSVQPSVYAYHPIRLGFIYLADLCLYYYVERGESSEKFGQ